MFEPDPSIRYIPAGREQVVALVESINQPQVSIPGKEPQAVQGFLCGLRNQNGSFSIFVSLFLPKTGENVVYASERREVGMEEYRDVEVEGLHFLESMGFMLDNLNFRNLAQAQQVETLKRVPLFQEPRPAGAARRGGRGPQLRAHRAPAGERLTMRPLPAPRRRRCSSPRLRLRPRRSARDKDTAIVHADLGAEAMNAGRAQDAMKSYDEALKYDPDLAEAHLGAGWSTSSPSASSTRPRPSTARPSSSSPRCAEAHNNLGQLLARTGRLEEAVKEFDVAASIMLYREPWVARCNKGQALWRMGKKDEGVAELKACLNFQPRYCQGWRELGRIQLSDGQGKDAVASFEQYAKICDKSADAQQLLGGGAAPDRTGGPGPGRVPEVRRARRGDADRRGLQEERRAAAVTTGAPIPRSTPAPRRSAPSGATCCASGSCAGSRPTTWPG